MELQACTNKIEIDFVTMRKSKKPLLGVSRCLLGENVRYDGTHKLDCYIRDELGRLVQWLPICPEVECGLPVPREPMTLVMDSGKLRLLSVKKTRPKDYTFQMLQWIEKKMAGLAQEPLAGFVLKARSPSCAVHDAAIWDSSKNAYSYGPGLFTQAILMRFLFLVCIDEEELKDPKKENVFMEKIFNLVQQK